MRAIRIFISSSSTSDSARVRRHGCLEQRLLLERLEVEILRQRVDQILVGHRRRHPRIAPALDWLGASSDSSFGALAQDRRAIGGVERLLAQRLDRRAAVAARVIFLDDPEPLDAAQHDVVAAVGQPLDVGDARRCSRSDRPAAAPRSRAPSPGRSSTMPIMRSPASASATISR